MEPTVKNHYVIVKALRTYRGTRFTTDAGEVWRICSTTEKLQKMAADILAGRAFTRGGADIQPEHYEVLYAGTDGYRAYDALHGVGA